MCMTLIKKICPNFTVGHKSYDYIVIHWFGVGTLESANTRFQNKDSQASAHYGISNDTVYQWVEEENTAWHAGVFDINQRSIGIEHDATTEHDASEETYKTSAQLIKEICQRHNIPIDRYHIKGHKEFKATKCPGTINIDKLISMANGIIEDMPDTITDLIKANGITEGDIRWLIDLKANQTVPNLEKQIEEYREQIHEYEVELQSLIAENTQYQKEILNWQKDISTAKESLQTIEEELQIMTTDRDTWRKRYNDKNDAYNELLKGQVSIFIKIIDFIKSLLSKWKK